MDRWEPWQSMAGIGGRGFQSCTPLSSGLPGRGELKDDELRASQAVQHVAGAHCLLKVLRDKLGIVSDKHSELEEALTNLEMALSALTVNTGGML